MVNILKIQDGTLLQRTNSLSTDANAIDKVCRIMETSHLICKK